MIDLGHHIARWRAFRDSPTTGRLVAYSVVSSAVTGVLASVGVLLTLLHLPVLLALLFMVVAPLTFNIKLARRLWPAGGALRWKGE